MDRKLEIAEIRVADLEFMLMDAESRVEQWRDQHSKLLEVKKDIEAQLNRAKDILYILGLTVDLRKPPNEDREKVNQFCDQQLKGAHMLVFEQANREYPLANDAWNRYMAALRLCGLDGQNTLESN